MKEQKIRDNLLTGRQTDCSVLKLSGSEPMLRDDAQTDVTLNTKSGTRIYSDVGIDERIPRHFDSRGYIITSTACSGGRYWGARLLCPTGITWYWRDRNEAVPLRTILRSK